MRSAYWLHSRLAHLGEVDTVEVRATHGCPRESLLESTEDTVLDHVFDGADLTLAALLVVLLADFGDVVGHLASLFEIL